MSATAVPSTVTDASRHKPILAERFKTKMCQNHEKTGSCPYETRCMFAHGEIELRTKQMNLHDNLVTEEAIKAFQRARVIAARAAAQKKLSQQARKDKKRAMQQQQQQDTAAATTQCSPGGRPSDSGSLPLDEAMLSSDSTLNRTNNDELLRNNSVSSASDFKTPATILGAVTSRDNGFSQENPLNMSNRSFRHDPYFGPGSPDTPGRGGATPSRMTPSRATVSPGAAPADLNGFVPVDPNMMSSYRLPPPMPAARATATSPSLAHMQFGHPQQQQQQQMGVASPPSRSPAMRYRDPAMTPSLLELKRYDSVPDMRETDDPMHMLGSSTTSQPAAVMQHPMPTYAPCACRDCHVRQAAATSGRGTPQAGISSAPHSAYTTPQHHGGHAYGTPMNTPHCAGNVPSAAAVLAGHNSSRPVLYQPCGPGGAIMRRGSPQVTSFDPETFE